MSRPPPPTVGQLGEERLVRALRVILDRPQEACSVVNGDDGLVWRPEGEVVATVDSVVEGVDWLAGVTPSEAIGHRAAAVNLSDLAAMGARPRVLLLALECPAEVSALLVVRACRGLAALADLHGCSVQGGDVGFSSGPMRWSVTALGDVQGPALTRRRAVSGDQVWLVGEVGAAALGLAWLRHFGASPPPGHWAEPFVNKHLWPTPLVEAGRALQAAATGGARIACIDISDGLGLDAGRLAKASGCGLMLELAAPAWPDEALVFAAERGLSAEELCGSGGDDYALLVTAPIDLDVSIYIRHLPITWALIGQVVVGPVGKVVLSVGGSAARASGWLHGG